MKTTVPQEIVTKLIELGKRDDIDSPSIAIDFKCLRSYEHLSRTHWREWYPVCEELPIDDHVALLKAVVMAERYCQHHRHSGSLFRTQ